VGVEKPTIRGEGGENDIHGRGPQRSVTWDKLRGAPRRRSSLKKINGLPIGSINQWRTNGYLTNLNLKRLRLLSLKLLVLVNDKGGPGRKR